jgi:hypothetical protein
VLRLGTLGIVERDRRGEIGDVAHNARGDLLRLVEFDWRGAQAEYRRALELSPNWLTIIEIQRGNAPAALDAAQQQPPGVFRDMAPAYAQQVSGDRSAADAALRTLIEKYADLSAYQIAEVYALRNDANATFKWLDRAWSNRDAGIQYLLYSPFILRYKDDPRFAAFCRKVGLPVPGEASARTLP